MKLQPFKFFNLLETVFNSEDYLARCLRIYIVVLFCLLSSFVVFGQNNGNSGAISDYYKRIEPSNDISGMSNVFKNYSVSNSGSINIPIPLYKVKTVNGFELPISLIYSSNGLRVEQIATDVGLGWTLNSGASVTKIVQGFPDDLNELNVHIHSTIRGYTFDEKLTRTFVGVGYSNNVSELESADLAKRRDIGEDVALGIYDASPDLYTLNLPHKSVNFIVSSNDNVHFLSPTSIKVEVVRAPSTFETMYAIPGHPQDELPDKYFKNGDGVYVNGEIYVRKDPNNNNSVKKWVRITEGMEIIGQDLVRKRGYPDGLIFPVVPFQGPVTYVQKFNNQHEIQQVTGVKKVKWVYSNGPPSYQKEIKGRILKFIVRDDNGLMYEIDQTETTVADSRSTSSTTWIPDRITNWVDNFPTSYYKGYDRSTDPYTYISAWRVSKICFPSSPEVIRFSYSNLNNDMQMSSNQKFDRTNYVTPIPGSSVSFNDPDLINTVNSRIVNYLRPESISWNAGSLEFNHINTRQDISSILYTDQCAIDLNDFSTSSASGCHTFSAGLRSFTICGHNNQFQVHNAEILKRMFDQIKPISFNRKSLDEIVVRNYNGDIVKKIGMDYSYFGNTSSALSRDKRLKLDRVNYINIQNSNETESIDLDYHLSSQVPSTISPEQDYWGFFNDNGAKHLIPELYYYPTRSSSDPFEAKVTIFPYQNTFDAQPPGGGAPSPLANNSNNSNYFLRVPYNFATRSPTTPSQTSIDISPADRSSDESSTIIGMLTKITYQTGGSRVFAYESNQFLDYLGNTIQGAGLRIKSIKNFGNNPNEAISTTSFTYSNGKLNELPVFGVLNNTKPFDQLQINGHNYLLDQPFAYVESCVNVQSHAVNPSINKLIGYDEITVTSPVGKIKTTYFNPISYLNRNLSFGSNFTNTSLLTTFLPNVEIGGQTSNNYDLNGKSSSLGFSNIDWLTSLPIYKRTYKTSGQLKTEEKYTYSFKNVESKIGISSVILDMAPKIHGEYRPQTFYRTEKKYLNVWCPMIESEVKEYEGSSFISSVIDYEYNGMNHFLPTKVSSLNSKQEANQVYYKYPGDYNNLSSTNSQGIKNPIGLLVDQNRLLNPIEVVKTITKNSQESLLDIEVNYYSSDLKSSNIPTLDNFYLNYDCQGILNVFKKNQYNWIGGRQPLSSYSGLSINSSGQLVLPNQSNYRTSPKVTEVNSYNLPVIILDENSKNIIKKGYSYFSESFNPFGSSVSVSLKRNIYETSIGLFGGTGSYCFSTTSFESDESDLLNFDPQYIVKSANLSNSGHTGLAYYNLGSSANGIDYNGQIGTQGNIIISFISNKSNSNDISISGSSKINHIVSSNDFNGWYLHEIEISNSLNFSVNSNASNLFIDELRIHSINSHLFSQTMEPLKGPTSRTSENYQREQYRYDGFNRVQYFRDSEGNIVKSFEYNFSN